MAWALGSAGREQRDQQGRAWPGSWVSELEESPWVWLTQWARLEVLSLKKLHSWVAPAGFFCERASERLSSFISRGAVKFFEDASFLPSPWLPLICFLLKPEVKSAFPGVAFPDLYQPLG